MNDFIRFNAESIWTFISEKGKMTFGQIGKHTLCRNFIIFMPIGLLLKEGKIHVEDKNGILYFRLNKNVSDTYY